MGVRCGVQRATLAEVSELLGISKGAVRQRVRRGTLRSDKVEDGRVYVSVDPSVDDVHADAQHGDGAQVEEERNARYRADELLARLMDRVQLEAPREATGGGETAEEEPESRERRPDAGEPQSGEERSWWQSSLRG